MDKVKTRSFIMSLSEALGRRFPCRDNEIVLPQKKYIATGIRALIFTTVFIFQVFVPHVAQAQKSPELTLISVGAPTQANLGDDLTVQAVLADSRGNPIAKETIYFTTRETFLNDAGDVVLAQAVTNKDGQAVAHFTDDFSAPITLRAEFRGDAQYAPSDAATQIGVVGDKQVYAEHISVDIPGFNVPPVVVPPSSAPLASLQSPAQVISQSIQRLWPVMNGWPIAAALIVVWTLYFRAVTFIFRIAAPDSESRDSAPGADRRRSP